MSGKAKIAEHLADVLDVGRCGPRFFNIYAAERMGYGMFTRDWNELIHREYQELMKIEYLAQTLQDAHLSAANVVFLGGLCDWLSAKNTAI